MYFLNVINVINVLMPWFPMHSNMIFNKLKTNFLYFFYFCQGPCSSKFHPRATELRLHVFDFKYLICQISTSRPLSYSPTYCGTWEMSIRFPTKLEVLTDSRLSISAINYIHQAFHIVNNYLKKIDTIIRWN